VVKDEDGRNEVKLKRLEKVAHNKMALVR